MIFTKSRNYEEITKKLDKNDVISVIGCSSCARVSGTGSNEVMQNLALKLMDDGYNVVEGYSINTMCTPKVFQAKLDEKVNTIITMSCSAGSSNVNQIHANKKVITTCEDIGLMEADTKERTIKIVKTYEGHGATQGQKFRMFTGEKV